MLVIPQHYQNYKIKFIKKSKKNDNKNKKKQRFLCFSHFVVIFFVFFAPDCFFRSNNFVPKPVRTILDPRLLFGTIRCSCLVFMGCGPPCVGPPLPKTCAVLCGPSADASMEGVGVEVMICTCELGRVRVGEASHPCPTGGEFGVHCPR